MTIDQYIKADRQWPRVLRIAHAQAELRDATLLGNSPMIKFWTAVVERNAQ